MNKKRKSGIRMLPYFRLSMVLIFAVSLMISGAILLTFSELELLWESPRITLMLCFALMCALLAGTVTAVMSKRILSPVVKLSTALSTVAKGDFTVRLEGDSAIKEIRQSFNNFNAMARKLAATETLQRDFVTNVSHEFKTPINAIEGYATLLQSDEELSPDQEENIEKILLNTRRLSELVGNILLLSKIENLAMPVKRERYRLDEEVRQAIVALETRWTEKKIELDIELDETAFTGNHMLMIHVWQNLIDNAIKFSPERGTICMRLKKEEGRIAFCIRDHGQGIEEGAMEHIFDKFYQGDTSHKSEGNGLGLSLVKYIVEIHGGEIRAENCSDGGSRFTVLLPEK